MNKFCKLIALFFAFAPCVSNGQNLVQNPGFENNTGFPTSYADWALATDWGNANANIASPDYFHVNGSFPVQLPNLGFSTVNPYQGDAVMGLAIWEGQLSNFREYMTQQLTTPLTVGSSYTFSFYITNGAPSSYGGYGVENVQVDFSVNPYNQTGSAPLGITPLWSLNSMLYEPNWIQLSFTFVATAPYAHFAIGNFANDANTVTQNFANISGAAAYYFIDEVSLVLTPPTGLDVLGDSQICLGDSTTLSAVNSLTYAWADSLNPSVIITTDSILTVAPTITTTYMVYGNSDTVSFTVNVNNYPVVNLGADTTLCVGQNLLLNATTANATYQWNDNSTTPTYNVTQQGTYSVLLTVNGCATPDTIVVNYNPSPVFTLNNDTTLCPGTTLLLNPATANATYIWQDNSTNASFNVAQAGIYWVAITVDNCSSTDSIQVSYFSLPTINLGNDTSLCVGETLVLEPSVLASAYLWQDNSTDTNYTVTQQGSYWVAASISNCIIRDTINVIYNLLPNLILGSDTTICDGDILVLNASIANATFLWQDNSTANTFTVTNPGIYWVEVDLLNCLAIDSITIDTIECNLVIEMPNIFTPNNDGLNDLFIPLKLKQITDATLEIYNRWGQKLIETSNMQTGWDGKHNGNDCNPGVYYWVVRYTTRANETETLTGFLTLLK